MEIDFCGLRGTVSEQSLDIADINTVFQQMSSKTVP